MTNYNATHSRLEKDYRDSPVDFIEYCKELFENKELTISELEQIIDNLPINESHLNELYSFMEENEAISEERARYSIREEDRQKARRETLRYSRAKTYIQRRINLNNRTNII